MDNDAMQVAEILADAVRVCTQISMSTEAKINIDIPAHVGAINFRVFSFGWITDADPDIVRHFYYGPEYPNIVDIDKLPAFIESLRARFIPGALSRAEYDKAVDAHERGM